MGRVRLGWPAALCARFEEDVAGGKENDHGRDAQERIFADVAGAEDEDDNTKTKTNDHRSEIEIESESGAGMDGEEVVDESEDEHAQSKTSSALASAAAGAETGQYPNVTFQFETYCWPFSASNDGVLLLQEQFLANST